MRYEGKSWCLFLKQTSNVLSGIYIYIYIYFLSFYLKPILKNQGIYSLKLVTLAFALDCNGSWIYKHKDISNNHNLLSISNLPPLFYQHLPLLGEMYPPSLLENKKNSSPHLLCSMREIQLWLIKTTCFTYLLLQINSVIIKTFNFKFKNFSFTKLPKKKP